MIPIVTVAQMRTIDKEAIGGETTVGFGYMLKAGMGILETVRKLQPDPAGGDIAIVCGKGNNGGDGYVAGGLLIDAGYNVMVFGLFDRDELRGEALMAFDEYALRKGNFLLLDDIEELNQLSRYSLVIDAILGSGIQGDPRGSAAKAIQAVNACGRPVLAVDTPSGLDNDTGNPGNPCISAATTVAMGFPKLGTLFYPGRRQVGALVIRDLGYPDDITTKHHGKIFTPTNDFLRKTLPRRRPAGSKIEHGLVLMVCGSG
ncbi:MAG: NAD(P)H-hydrate epimerase, partial [Chitinivibrionales bacterium]|nr:NAD(P)H-hydrate epimerase [Chitinivibrionales bacterium]